MSRFAGTGQSSLKLNGFLGKFTIPNSSFSITFFSTVANSQETAYKSFLRKLEPLRDKIEPSSIEDFGTLMQRDINDNRIAHEIIPYLINEINGRANNEHIAFFPSVLCVLMPINFLNSENVDHITYPKPEVLENSNEQKITKYGESWKVLEYKENENNTRYAQIEIFDDSSDFLVLDGQHRTNAFRAATKLFPGNNTIYKSFYQDIVFPENFTADLPVTLIWFESSGPEIKSSFISRNLFIDVNNNSKIISNSRLILLNDKKPDNLVTRFFYTYLGKNHNFDLSKLSLFHFAFDYDGNISDKKVPFCPLSVFVPEIINHSLDWFFFSSTSNAYNLGKTSVKRGENVSFDFFDLYFNSTSAEFFEIASDEFDEKIKITKSEININELKQITTIDSDIFQIIYELYQGFPFIKNITNSTAILNEDYLNNRECFDQNTARQLAYSKAILGAESLYYTLQALPDGVNIYKTALNEPNGILDRFNEILISQFLNTNVNLKLIYNRISTVVFSTGYIMAFRYFRTSRSETLNESKIEFLDRINAVGEEYWINFIGEFWNLYFGAKESSPKLWPLVTNMFLRLIQKDGEFFNNPTARLKSPEAILVERVFVSKLEEYRANSLDGKKWESITRSEFSTNQLDMMIQNSITKIDDIFSQVGLIKDITIDYEDLCRNKFYDVVRRV